MSSPRESRRASATLPLRGSQIHSEVKRRQRRNGTLSDAFESLDPPESPSPAATQSRQLDPITQDSLALGMHVKNPSMPNIRPDGRVEFGPESPEVDSGNKMQNPAPLRQSNLLRKQAEPLTGRPERSKSDEETISSGLVHADLRAMSTLRTDVERSSLSAYDSPPPKPVPERFLGVPDAIGEPSAWASSLYSDMQSTSNPWISTEYEELSLHGGTTTSSSHVFAPFHEREDGCLGGHSISPPYRSAAAPLEATPLVNDGTPSPCTERPIHSRPSSRSSLLDSKTDVLNQILEENQAQPPQLLSNDVGELAGSTALSSMAEGASGLPHSDTKVRPVQPDTAHDVSAISSANQAVDDTWTSRLLSTIVAALATYGSALLPSSSSPSLNERLLQSDAGKASNDFQHAKDTLPSKRSSTPVPTAGMWPPVSDDVKTGGEGRTTPHRGYGPVNATTPGSPPCISSPGSSGRVWQWKPTDDRAKYRHAFFRIVEVLGEQFTPDMNPGCIYAFQVEDQVDNGRKYTKIGEAYDIAARMKEHKSCYGNCTLVYPAPNEAPLNLEHAKYVERLIHAELVTRGLFVRPCPRPCAKGKSHNEWFDVDAQHAIQVIQRWTRWAQKSRFEAVEAVEKLQRRPLSRGVSPETPGAKSASNSSTNLLLKPPQKFGLKVFEKEELLKMCWPLESLPTDSTIVPSQKQ